MAELVAGAAAESSCSLEAKIPVVAVVIMPCKLPGHSLAAAVEAAVVAAETPGRNYSSELVAAAAAVVAMA